MEDNSLPPGFSLDQSQPGSAAAGGASDLPAGFELDEEKYGGLGQQALAGLEGVGKGVLGPLSPLIEKGLGIKPQDIRGRAEFNPVTHGVGEAVGLGGSLLLGVGEGALAAKAGEAAAQASKLGIEGASTISKIAAHGIQTGAEMAAIQAGDEVSKMITEDPNQSLGTAAINVGLSGLMGGAGGAIIGSISPLWKASMEKMGVPKLIDEAKAQYEFRQGLPNGGDVPAAVTGELTTRMAEVDALKDQMGNLKASSLARAMPEVTEANTAKINSQIEEISSAMTKNIEKAADNAYLKGAVPKLVQDFQDFLEVVTNPESAYVDKFDAIDTLKRAQQDKVRYNLTAEDSALGAFTKNTARDLRLALEDPKVWGEAGNIQRDVNAAIKSSIDAEKDAASKFTSKVLGERVADPSKVNTLINQTLKGKAGLKTNILNNYLEHTEGLADTINKIHVDAGLDAPIRLTPTPALSHSLGRSSAGTTLGNWLFDKGLGTLAGDSAAAATGAGLGTLVGHPAFGAVAGERILAPAFRSIAKPLMESASRSEAFKGAIDYAASVVKGEKLLNKAAESLFKAGAEVIPEHLVPDFTSRMRLEQSIAHNQDSNNALDIAGNLGHYLPDHATAAAATAATGSNYLNSLKPKQPQASPLDRPAPIDKFQKAKYDRALDIAQQPLLVLQHAKKGTLQAQDVQTLQQIYPALHAKIVKKAYDQMAHAIAQGQNIPFKQRQSLSLLMGTPLDSSLSQPVMMAVMASNAPKGNSQQQAQGGRKGVSKSTPASMEKVNSMYATPNQSRAAHRARD